MTSEKENLETATLAGGCFWCLEAVFRMVDGVVRVQSGYAGGTTKNPTYEEVSSGRTGHAESVQVTFDAGKITYREILGVFFSAHDPTTLNRQGPDTGTQYRSVIFYHSPAQKAVAEQVIRELTEARKWKDAIVTELVPAGDFWPAEPYHDQYYERNPRTAYSQMVIAPKVARVRSQMAGRMLKK